MSDALKYPTAQEPDYPYIDFSETTESFKKCQARMGISTIELARELGKCRRTITRYRNGETEPPRLVMDYMIRRAATSRPRPPLLPARPRRIKYPTG